MIQSIVEHFQKMLPVWIVGIIISGCGVAISGVIAWNNLQHDLTLIKCKLGVEESIACRWTTTIVEDIDKATLVEEDEDDEDND